MNPLDQAKLGRPLLFKPTCTAVRAGLGDTGVGLATVVQHSQDVTPYQSRVCSALASDKPQHAARAALETCVLEASTASSHPALMTYDKATDGTAKTRGNPEQCEQAP